MDNILPTNIKNIFFQEKSNTNTISILENDDDIINNVISKITDTTTFQKIDNDTNDIDTLFTETKKKSKFEIAEEKIINKIYEKFKIIKNVSQNEQIDLVYTYINYNDKDYKNLRMEELKNKKILGKYNFDERTNKIYESYLKNEKESFNDFFLNIEITRTNFPCIRKIFIITPTPFSINEIYSNDNQIIVIPLDEICNNEFDKIYFRSNNIVKYIANVKFISRIFLFGCSDSLIINALKKEYFLKNNIPVSQLQRKTLLEKNIDDSTNLKYLEEFNTNNIFEERFHIFPKLVGINQLTIMRKDAISITNKLFKDSNSIIDFQLLQYLTGYFFNLYELRINKNNSSGFYQYTQKMPLERFNIIKNKSCDFFCMNHMNEKYLFYYAYAYFINIGLIENNAKNVIFITNNRYIIPTYEKKLLSNCKKLSVSFSQNIKEESFADNIYIVISEKIGEDSKFQNASNLIIEVCEKYFDLVIPDILFFANCYVTSESIFKNCNINKFKDEDKIIRINYPKKIIQNLESKSHVPYTRILNLVHYDEETLGVKMGKIFFKKNLSKKN